MKLFSEPIKEHGQAKKKSCTVSCAQETSLYMKVARANKVYRAPMKCSGAHEKLYRIVLDCLCPFRGYEVISPINAQR